MRRFKYPLMVLGLMATGMALMYWYSRLGLNPPFSLTCALLMSAVASDYGTTVKATRMGGKEGNPFVGMLFNKIGAERGGLIVVGLFILFVIFVFRNSPPYQQLALASVYWVIPVNNLIIIKRLGKPKAEA